MTLDDKKWSVGFPFHRSPICKLRLLSRVTKLRPVAKDAAGPSDLITVNKAWLLGIWPLGLARQNRKKRLHLKLGLEQCFGE
jgi:hypothetical protein